MFSSRFDRATLTIVILAGFICLSPKIAKAQDHVTELVRASVDPTIDCLQRHTEAALPQTVLIRLELPPGSSPEVLYIASTDSADENTLERCLRQSLAWVNIPQYRGPVLRTECLFPLEEGRDLQCRPGPSGEIDPRPIEQEQSEVQPNETPQPDETPLPDETPQTNANQEQTLRKNSMTLNPLGMIVGGIDLKFTRFFPHSSLGLGVAFQIPLVVDTFGIVGLVEVLGWINDRPNTGFYLGATVMFGKRYRDTSAFQVTPLAVFGHRWLFRQGIVLGIAGSAGYIFYSSDCRNCDLRSISQTVQLDNEGKGGAFYARLIFDFGVAF